MTRPCTAPSCRCDSPCDAWYAAHGEADHRSSTYTLERRYLTEREIAGLGRYEVVTLRDCVLPVECYSTSADGRTRLRELTLVRCRGALHLDEVHEVTVSDCSLTLSGLVGDLVVLRSVLDRLTEDQGVLEVQGRIDVLDSDLSTLDVIVPATSAPERHRARSVRSPARLPSLTVDPHSVPAWRS